MLKNTEWDNQNLFDFFACFKTWRPYEKGFSLAKFNMFVTELKPKLFHH